MNKKIRFAGWVLGSVILIGLFLGGFFGGFRGDTVISPSGLRVAEIDYPIIIVGDDGWVSFRGAGNCTGAGTEGDPYVIEDRIIDALGSSPCIFVVDSSAYFRVENCTILNSVGGSYGGITLMNALHGDLVGNNITNNPTGIVLRYSNLSVIEGNSITNNGYGIVLDTNCEKDMILGNNITGNQDGISLQDLCMDNQILNNNVSENTVNGISLLAECKGNIVSQNIVNNNSYKGIYLSQNAFNNSIISNSAKENGKSGIWLNFESANNSITTNNVSLNGEDGIRVEGTSSNNTIAGNKVQNNTVDGLQLLDNCQNNTFVQNYVVGNLGYGANVSSGCDGNLFYANNFSFNEVGNAMDTGAYNGWDNGSIGNYWADYGGADTDGDGIGDVPQPVPGGSIEDNFPIWGGDEIPPQIQVNAPLIGSIFGTLPPILDVTITDVSFAEAWYVIGTGTVNYSITPIYQASLDAAAWDSLGNGTVTITVWANDSVGNYASQSISIQKDVLPPVVEILEPKNLAFLGETPPMYNVSVIDENFQSTWLVIITSDGMVNYTLPNFAGVIPQEIWDQVPMGTHKVRVYANDTLGNEAYDEITIIKTTGQIPGYPLELLCIFVAVVCLFSWRRMRRRFSLSLADSGDAVARS